jgi:hypothetical protein
MNHDKQKQKQDPIPLLKDIISEEELESEYISFIGSETESSSEEIQEYSEVLLAIKDDIARQLQDELWTMVSTALNQAIKEAARRAAKTLHRELDKSLQQRIKDLIEEQLDAEFSINSQSSKPKIKD